MFFSIGHNILNIDFFRTLVKRLLTKYHFFDQFAHTHKRRKVKGTTGKRYTNCFFPANIRDEIFFAIVSPPGAPFFPDMALSPPQICFLSDIAELSERNEEANNTNDILLLKWHILTT